MLWERAKYKIICTMVVILKHEFKFFSNFFCQEGKFKNPTLLAIL